MTIVPAARQFLHDYDTQGNHGRQNASSLGLIVHAGLLGTHTF